MSVDRNHAENLLRNCRGWYGKVLANTTCSLDISGQLSLSNEAIMKLKRATSVAEMRNRMSKFTTDAGVSKGHAFQPEATDVFITPYPKCGTTWVQQIVHGLRTGGSMEFSEITEVVPWLELAHDMGTDIGAPQVAAPRAFKSHLRWQDIPKGGRYINVYRDPEDALVSMYHFLEGWFFEPGTISLTEFAEEFFMKRQDAMDYWEHAASWWRQAKRDDVLLLCFEHMKQDLPGSVRRIADFMGCPPDRDLLTLVVNQSKLEFMKQHASQFDDHLIRESRDAACGLPPGGDCAKVRHGTPGDGRQALSPCIIDALKLRWANVMTEEFQLGSYENLLDCCQSP